MVDLLRVNSWKLDLDQLIEKHRQVRKLMWLLFIPFTMLYLIGVVTWVFTSWVILPVLCFYLSIILFIVLTEIKMHEFTLTVIICNKKS